MTKRKRSYKNPNGYGSISKLSGRRRNPYMVRKFQRFAANGQAVYKVIGYYPTRTKAQEALVDYNRNPQQFDVDALTFADVWKMFTKQKYTDHGKDISNSYIAAYNWLAPVHNMKFKDVKLMHLQQVVNDCDRGPSTKKNIKVLAGLLFKYAIGNDIADKNYASLLEVPQVMQSDIHHPYTKDELQLLWQHSDSLAVQTILIMAYTGMRPGSLFAMKTENVHLNEQYMIGGIKTAGAKNRVIPIADCILEFVKNLYNPKKKYLFMHKGRKANSNTYAKSYFEPAMRELGFDHLPHDGRSTCETFLDRLKVQRSVIDAIMGHQQQSIGEKDYREVDLNDRLEAVNQMPHWNKRLLAKS